MDRAEDTATELDLRRKDLRAFLKYTSRNEPVPVTVEARVEESAFTRKRVRYPAGDGDTVPAYLLEPMTSGPHAAVVIHHQHNSQWHFGKSEVCGLVGDPLQAFGPALVEEGFVVLAPDSICFEDRRSNRKGTDADEAGDWAQHYHEFTRRLLRGDTLMRKVLSDADASVGALRSLPGIDPERIGILGHSYGGNTVLFHAALDERISFACASGAAANYRHKITHGIGIEMAEIIPGFIGDFDISDLVKCAAPHPLLIVSADADPYSADADAIEAEARPAYASLGAADALVHHRYSGGHAMTQQRFTRIVEWLVGIYDARTG